MADAQRTTARFPDVPLGAGHYESFYLKACHPSEPLGLWLRHTVHKRPGAAPVGSLWLTLFDGAADGPWAVKTTTADVGAAAGEHVHVGEARFEPGRAVGSATAAVPGTDERRSASWDLRLTTGEEPLRHLPREWMYRARLPRTKLLSPYPDARYDGRVEVDGRTVELDGWRGMVGHNWGAEHAERWIWTHGAGFEGRDDAWLDLALGRIKVGPWLMPWVANGALRLDGVRHRLGGLGAARRTEVDDRPSGARIALPGDGVDVEVSVGAAPERFVGWIYADPDGSEHNVANCSISDMELTVTRPGESPQTLTVAAGAAYELGMRERDHGIAVQPFPDG